MLGLMALLILSAFAMDCHRYGGEMFLFHMPLQRLLFWRAAVLCALVFLLAWAGMPPGH